MSKYDQLAPAILRLGLAIVFAWFGWQQLTHPGDWIAFVPSLTTNPWLTPESLILINGWAEIVAATLLFTGFQTRAVALLLCFHLLVIATHAGGAIGVRDFGLALACLALALLSVDRWTLDAKLQNE